MDFQQDINNSSRAAVNIMAISPSPPNEDFFPANRSTILRSRRNNIVLPILSTSPTANPTPAPDNSSTPASTCTADDQASCTPCPAASLPVPITTSKAIPIHSKERQDMETNGAPLDISDFECPLCIQVYFQPVTTVCGHVFCKQCLFRSIKHSPACPLCRHKLDLNSGTQQKYSVNIVLNNVIEKYFPKEHKERAVEEQSNAPMVPTPEADDNDAEDSVVGSNWTCILPSLRSTCTVFLACGGGF